MTPQELSIVIMWVLSIVAVLAYIKGYKCHQDDAFFCGKWYESMLEFYFFFVNVTVIVGLLSVGILLFCYWISRLSQGFWY